MPITQAPASAVPTGVVFFVSNSISTSTGTPIAVAITFFQATVNPSSLVVTGSSGRVFTVPTALLQSAASLSTPTRVSPSNASVSSASSGTGGSGSENGASDGGSSGLDGVKVAILAWPKSKTFLGSYLPVMVAKFYQMGWAVSSIHFSQLEGCVLICLVYS